MSQIIEQQFFNKKQSAQIVGRSPRTIHTWIAKGYLAKKRAYTIDDLNQAVAVADGPAQERAA